MKTRQILSIFALAMISHTGNLFAQNGNVPDAQKKYNFNSDWKLFVGEAADAANPSFNDSQWKSVTLPHAWNEDEAFAKGIKELSTATSWYRKHFVLPKDSQDKKVFIEFEGVRQAGEVFVNGKSVGLHENGVMGFAMDITPYLKPAGEDNVIAVDITNSWTYHEKSTNSPYQWNDSNFNANYGGISKNVFLHIKSPVYQTLPLYSNLGTTGVYVYAEGFDIAGKKANIHAESQVKNETKSPQKIDFEVSVEELNGKVLKTFKGQTTMIEPGAVAVVSAFSNVENLNFWSWGYGYLYHVRTNLIQNGKTIDSVTTTTGFRKTGFTNGYLTLNDRPIQLKGFAQRTSNEWPAMGVSVPAWLSDYSNGMIVQGNGNLVRWMHITPWKQDVESCDRVGLMQAMPAGDSERDPTGRRWEQRVEVMRDAIIYNRNNPSIIFYECGNNGITEEHMAEMKAVRDQYDPHGGRAIGSRNMQGSKVAEYGGEMLYINKSGGKPMWATEYSRDEGARKYWDELTPPFHKTASPSNHNQDTKSIEDVVRWYDYYKQRPGTGSRVSGGGVKIIFSDSNTHFRNSEVKYRTSGEVDAMRLPKDGFFTHQVMWDGWVDVENPRAHIVGHWNYTPGTKKDINVVCSADHVKLSLNGKDLGDAVQSNQFLFTFANIEWQPGSLVAIGYDKNNKEVCKSELKTAGEPVAIKLTPTISPTGFSASGADVALVDVEVVDANGVRNPIAMNTINFSLNGPAEWRGGIALGQPDNYILSKDLPVECGVNRVIVRSTTQAGKITLTAKADGLKDASIMLETKAFSTNNGLTMSLPNNGLKPHLDRGPTPSTPSIHPTFKTLAIKDITAGSNADKAKNATDDNETTTWAAANGKGKAWINFQLESPAKISMLSLKMNDWRNKSYPIRVLVDDKEVYTGNTPKSLGYVDIALTPTVGQYVKIESTGKADTKDEFNNIVEVTGNKLDENGNQDEAVTDGIPPKPTTTPSTTQAATSQPATRRSNSSLSIIEVEIKEAVGP